MHGGTHIIGGRGDEISFFFLQWRETLFSVPSFLEIAQGFCCAPHHPPSLAAYYELPAQISTTCTARSSALAGKAAATLAREKGKHLNC